MFGSNWVKAFNRISIIMDDLSITKQTVYRIESNLDTVIEKQNEEIKALREELRRRTDYYENLLMAVIQNQMANPAKAAPPAEPPKKSMLEAYLEAKKSNGGLPLPG